MGGIAKLFGGAGASGQQKKLMALQEAQQKRARLREDERETELSRQEALQRRAVAARRRGGAGLAYSGPVSDLKTTLGG